MLNAINHNPYGLQSNNNAINGGVISIYNMAKVEQVRFILTWSNLMTSLIEQTITFRFDNQSSIWTELILNHFT